MNVRSRPSWVRLGRKESGLGREGSVLGLEEFLEVKTLHIGGDYNRQGGICRPPVPGGWQ